MAPRLSVYFDLSGVFSSLPGVGHTAAPRLQQGHSSWGSRAKALVVESRTLPCIARFREPLVSKVLISCRLHPCYPHNQSFLEDDCQEMGLLQALLLASSGPGGVGIFIYISFFSDWHIFSCTTFLGTCASWYVLIFITLR